MTEKNINQIIISDVQTTNMPAELKCKWCTGEQCSGEVRIRNIFKGTVQVPMCDGHLEEHSHIMFLYANGFELNIVLGMSATKRKEKVKKIIEKLSDIE